MKPIARTRENPLYHLAALCKWAGKVAGENPRISQWVVTGLLSFLIGGGAAIGISKAPPLREQPQSSMDRQWLADSFPVILRPTIRAVVKEENAPVFAKLDTMEEKNFEVRRFIVGTSEYRRWKRIQERRHAEEERINAEAERGFSRTAYGSGDRLFHRQAEK